MDDTDGSGVMYVKGSDEVVQVQTGESYATLYDLPRMPYAVLDNLKRLTVETVDMAVHGACCHTSGAAGGPARREPCRGPRRRTSSAAGLGSAGIPPYLLFRAR